MSEESGGGNPFAPRTVLLLVLAGSLLFVALLWMIGAGLTTGSTNDGGSHVGSKGLNGYAALALYLEKQGYNVRRSRSAAALDTPGLLVLTPPQSADGAELDRIVAHRHLIGPTLVVTPKWLAIPVPRTTPGSKKGWVQLVGTSSPNWKGFRDDVGVTIAGEPDGPGGAQWVSSTAVGKLPVPAHVQSGSGKYLVPLVVTHRDGRVLAAFIDDDGSYPALSEMALGPRPGAARHDSTYPLVFVFEPDLLDNFGMADFATARLAERLIRAAGENSDGTVTFDLTLNGYARSANLLTLAFTPPFLAATLCLLMAALAVGWRAFLRFGPPRRQGRAIAFGKRALVANTAGLIRRTRRLHLVSAPYVGHARERFLRLLALPRQADAAAANAAIDRALAARLPDAPPFSTLAVRLIGARSPHEALRAAQELHALERMLTR